MNNLEQLNKLAQENERFAAELEALNKKVNQQAVDETVALANEYGLNLSAKDLEANELSVEDLDLVSGGIAKRNDRKVRVKS